MTPATVAELQAATGLGREAVKQAIRRGELPGSLVGSRYVIPREAFERYVRGEWIAQPRPLDIKPLSHVQLVHRRTG